MAGPNKKTSEEAAAAALTGTEEIRGVQSSANVKITATQIKTFANSTPTFTGTTTAQGLLDISGASAGQIKFPATQNASGDANTLDDYEEGTFTPGLAFGGGTTGITYTTQLGWYQKVGYAVTIVFNIKLSNKGSSVGSASITGLPFTCNATVFSIFACRIENIDLNVAGGFYSAGVANTLGGTTLSVREQGDNVAVTSLTDVDFGNTSEICGSGTYFV